MKMAIFTNVNFFNSLNVLMNQDGISVLVSYELKGIKEVLIQELAKYEELRKELVQKLANKDEKGAILRKEDGAAIFTEENQAIFTKKFKELQDIEFELPPKVKLDDIKNAKSDTTPLKPQDLLNLASLIEK